MVTPYWELLHARICHRCIDGDGKGNCRLPATEQCALKVFLPEIITTITKMQSGSYHAYVNALRNQVCSQCDAQRADGTCSKRETLECALDRYYPLIVEVIESVRADAKLFPAGQKGS